MKVFFIFLIFVSGALAQDLKSKVDSELAQRHPTTTKDDWLAFGNEAVPVLIQAYHSSPETYKKLRVLEIVGFFTTNAAREFLAEQTGAELPDVLKIGLITGLKRQGDVGALRAYLKHPNAKIRAHAVVAVHEVGASESPRKEEAKKAVVDFEKTEKEAWVLKRLHDAKSPRRPLQLPGRVKARSQGHKE